MHVAWIEYQRTREGTSTQLLITQCHTKRYAYMQHTERAEPGTSVLQQSPLLYKKLPVVAVPEDGGSEQQGSLRALHCLYEALRTPHDHPKQANPEHTTSTPHLQALGIFGCCEVVCQGLNRRKRGRGAGGYDTARQRHQRQAARSRLAQNSEELFLQPPSRFFGGTRQLSTTGRGMVFLPRTR